MVKIILLRNGSLTDYLIGKITEMDEEPVYLVEECYRILDGKLEAYTKYAAQRDLFLTSESVFTIVEPSKQILGEYQKTNV